MTERVNVKVPSKSVLQWSNWPEQHCLHHTIYHISRLFKKNMKQLTWSENLRLNVRKKCIHTDCKLLEFSYLTDTASLSQRYKVLKYYTAGLRSQKARFKLMCVEDEIKKENSKLFSSNNTHRYLFLVWMNFPFNPLCLNVFTNAKSLYQCSFSLKS